MRTHLSLAAFVLLLGSVAVAADSWPGFRGPNGDGHSPSKNPPIKWSEKENVAWKTEIHGKGWSSPVVLGDQVWVTTSDEVLETAPVAKKGPPANPVKEASLFAVCADRKSGKVLHNLKLGTVQKPQYCHPFNSYASCTPFIEEGRLYAHFGSLGTFCVDTQTGKKLWERLDFKCDHFRGPGSSIAVYGDLMYLIFDGADLQYVVALDKKTGETKWKTDRKIKYGPGPGDGDHKKAYATPSLLKIAGKDSLVCPSAECTIAYDPKSGEEQWRFSHGGMNGALRPVLANGLLYATSGHSGKLFALKPDLLKGDVPKDAVAWQAAKNVSVRPSLLVAGDLLFMVSDSGVATCRDAVSGKPDPYWTERLDGEFSASPVLANGNIYLCNQVGKTFVVKAEKEYTLIGENRLDGGFMASPAIAGDELFLRTKTHLYSIGKK